MTAIEILESLDNLGVIVVPQGDRLRFRPKAAVPNELLQEMAAHKTELLSALQAKAPTSAPAPCPWCRSAIALRLADGRIVCPACDPPHPDEVLEKLILCNLPDGDIWRNFEEERAEHRGRDPETDDPADPDELLVSPDECIAVPAGYIWLGATRVSEEDNEFYWGEIQEDPEAMAYLNSPKPTPCSWCGGRYRHNPLCAELLASWEPTLPWGKHRGKRISQVPRDYLVWLIKNSTNLDSELRQAIKLHLRSE